MVQNFHMSEEFEPSQLGEIVALVLQAAYPLMAQPTKRV
jgi:hypothetical protein